MRFCRLMLIVSVGLLASCIALVALAHPRLAVVVLVIWCIGAARKGYRRLTAHGTARWCDADELRRAGMLDADSGLILGRIKDSGATLWPAIKGLFDRRVDAATACEQFLAAVGKPKERLVRLAHSVHVSCYAPSGVGKGVSCVVPFLKTCPESCVVVDFKGELALLTAEHREKMFGHKIIILDPFKVVTQ